MRRILSALLVAPCLALAGEPWDTTDKALGIAALTFLAIDYGQTRNIALNPERYHEINPILGRHPSVGRVNNYFALTAVGGYFLADWLPSRDRKWFLGAVTMLEVVITNHNRSIGIKVEF